SVTRSTGCASATLRTSLLMAKRTIPSSVRVITDVGDAPTVFTVSGPSGVSSLVSAGMAQVVIWFLYPVSHRGDNDVVRCPFSVVRFPLSVFRCPFSVSVSDLFGTLSPSFTATDNGQRKTDNIPSAAAVDHDPLRHPAHRRRHVLALGELAQIA